MLCQLGTGEPHPRGVITCELAAEAAEGGGLQRQAVAAMAEASASDWPPGTGLAGLMSCGE
jgi:hypothetical protein